MRIIPFLSFIIISFANSNSSGQSNDSLMLRKIFNEAVSNGKSYSNLEYLCTKIGHRLSGSPQAAAAVEWARQAMVAAGADTVYLQEVMVPHWVRGEKEFAKIVNSKSLGSQEVPILALGGSIATPTEGITAEVIEIQNFDELAKHGEKNIKGKIIFCNRPMDPTEIFPFAAYGKAVGQRWSGAMEAAKYGAVGVIVRSMTLAQDDFPHTGSMGYKDSIPKIPACAISTNGANLLSKLLKTENGLRFHFKMNCQILADVKSYNVVGEIKGSEHPEEIIVVGGHLDSWDAGDGAHDDGAGVAQSIEVLRIMKALEIKLKRTIRAVAFMNEENGGKGGEKYAELAKLNNEKHIAAIESDAGGFSPRGFNFAAAKETKERREKVVKWKYLFEPYGINDFSKDGGGADISPLGKQDVLLIGLMPDPTRYFDFHHTDNDIFKNVNKRELELGGAATTMLLYLLVEHGL